MGERIEKIEKMLKSFEIQKKRIIRKYDSKSIEKEINDIDNALSEINNNLKRKEMHIERLKEELEQVSPSEKALIDEYNKSIENANKEYEEEKINLGMQKYLDKKEELSVKLKQSKSSNEKLIEQETRNAEDKLRINLTRRKYAIRQRY